MSEGEEPRRYLSATVLNGWIYLTHAEGLDGTLHLSYWTRQEVHKALDPEKGDRLIHSVSDLEETLQLSKGRSLRTVFVPEGLEEEGRRRSKPRVDSCPRQSPHRL